MIIYYTYTVISTVLTIFKNFSSSLHDNVLHQCKHHFNASIVERIRHTGKYCDERFLCYNGDMSILFSKHFFRTQLFCIRADKCTSCVPIFIVSFDQNVFVQFYYKTIILSKIAKF